jgi:hypothetical protein
MTPSAYFRQHHHVAAPRVDDRVFHVAWRVRTRLDALLDRRAITLREWRAAVEYRALWETAFGDLLATPQWAARRGRGRPTDHYIAERLDALRALSGARKRLGAGTWGLLEACVIDDLSWNQIGRCLGVDHKTARARTITAIKELALVAA